eukprot:4536623-Prymnesium_polylepis.1
MAAAAMPWETWPRGPTHTSQREGSPEALHGGRLRCAFSFTDRNSRTKVTVASQYSTNTCFSSR